MCLMHATAWRQQHHYFNVACALESAWRSCLRPAAQGGSIKQCGYHGTRWTAGQHRSLFFAQSKDDTRPI